MLQILFFQDLGIKNSLHRKRLRCILNTIACEKPDISERMDVHQVNMKNSRSYRE